MSEEQFVHRKGVVLSDKDLEYLKVVQEKIGAGFSPLMRMLLREKYHELIK